MRARPDLSPPDGRYVVFDLETLEYLSHEVRGGWRNIRDFGLAVGVTIDEHGQQHVWQEARRAGDLIDYLAEHPRVVGFNSRRFDLTVLSAYGDVSVLRERSFDVLLELQSVTGRRKGMRLQDIAGAMLRRSQVAERRHGGRPPVAHRTAPKTAAA